MIEFNVYISMFRLNVNSTPSSQARDLFVKGLKQIKVAFVSETELVTQLLYLSDNQY